MAGDLLRSVHILEALRDMFEYKDDKGKDQVRGGMDFSSNILIGPIVLSVNVIILKAWTN